MSKIFSLEGKALKLETADDIEPYIKELKENPDVEEILLQGNTLGVEAIKTLADDLKDKKNLKVRLSHHASSLPIANLCLFSKARQLRRHLHRPPQGRNPGLPLPPPHRPP